MISIRNRGLFPCLVCGVDSTPVLIFFLVLVGGILAASVSIFLWGVGTKKFSQSEMENLPLVAEETIERRDET